VLLVLLAKISFVSTRSCIIETAIVLLKKDEDWFRKLNLLGYIGNHNQQ